MKRLLLNLLVFSMISMSALAKERQALVIGNSDYKVNPLSNPVNDARDMANMLGKLGFDVTLKVNADQMTMESAIEAFGKKLRKNANAVGLFYFSGHGAQYAGDNYLIPINSIHRTSAARHLRYKAVPAGYVLGAMQDNSLNIVILDACRDNPFKGFSKSLRQGLTRMESVEGTLIAYATAPGTVAWGGEAGERNSPYTKHLLRFMTQPNLSIESMLKKVRKAVIRETRNESIVQKPWYEASISDDFSFVENFQISTIPAIQPETPIHSSYRYTDNGNGTVTDNRSGLIWLKNANCFGGQKWKKAMQSAVNLASGQCGLRDGSRRGMWRLPSKDEWEAMIDEKYDSLQKPGLALSNAAGTDKWKEGDAFSGVQTNNYWSSTTTAGGTTGAWGVYLNGGGVGSYDEANTYYVWPVRGGQ
jgi:hypothetical protein